MTVKICLKEHLNTLKRQEKAKPVPQRRVVPTIEDLANEAGISRQHLSSLINNQTSLVNLDILGSTLHTLNTLGFSSTLEDVLKYEPD